jgi:hypothetical protein
MQGYSNQFTFLNSDSYGLSKVYDNMALQAAGTPNPIKMASQGLAVLLASPSEGFVWLQRQAQAPPLPEGVLAVSGGLVTQ